MTASSEQFVCLSHAGGLYFGDVICARRYSCRYVSISDGKMLVRKLELITGRVQFNAK